MWRSVGLLCRSVLMSDPEVVSQCSRDPSSEHVNKWLGFDGWKCTSHTVENRKQFRITASVVELSGFCHLDSKYTVFFFLRALWDSMGFSTTSSNLKDKMTWQSIFFCAHKWYQFLADLHNRLTLKWKHFLGQYLIEISLGIIYENGDNAFFFCFVF